MSARATTALDERRQVHAELRSVTTQLQRVDKKIHEARATVIGWKRPDMTPEQHPHYRKLAHERAGLAREQSRLTRRMSDVEAAIRAAKPQEPRAASKIRYETHQRLMEEQESRIAELHGQLTKRSDAAMDLIRENESLRDQVAALTSRLVCCFTERDAHVRHDPPTVCIQCHNDLRRQIAAGTNRRHVVRQRGAA